jgi:Domain of unknown function (DUF1840)
MVVKFSTRHGQLTLLGDSAIRLLELGGHSGTVPGAILAADLAAFLARLRAGLEVHGGEPSPSLPPEPADPEDRDEDAYSRRPSVSLQHRAVPMIAMIETAIRNGSDLMWERA